MIQKYIRLFSPMFQHSYNLERTDHDDLKLGWPNEELTTAKVAMKVAKNNLAVLTDRALFCTAAVI